MWITLNKLLYAPLQHAYSEPIIHQGERLYGRLLPSVRRVSEKNSSRRLAEQLDRSLLWWSHYLYVVFLRQRLAQARGCLSIITSGREPFAQFLEVPLEARRGHR